ncbi:MAG: hypothetical protein PHY93_08295, partial [Bacteriovorax sp.]|nr:hypothetical protein [Bacteriovorax sp.]
YIDWVKSDKLSADIFSNKKSNYYGIKTDCADAAIALRVIYAFEQQLPVYFKDNDGNIITNESLKYDFVPVGIERLKAMLEDLSNNIGSEVLADGNTYPISLSDVRPGDVYITKWRDASGIDTRHVYFIKDILPTGDLLLYSSTQPTAIRPLLIRKGMPSHIIDGPPYGFKRFTRGKNFEKADQSWSQYEYLKQGQKYYFSKIKESHQMLKDTLENNINQRLENICVALQTRADVISATLEYIVKNNNRCFSKEEYDEYSTPSRDHNISFDIENLIYGWKIIKQRQKQSELPENIQQALEYLAGKDLSDNASNALNTFCLIKFESLSGQQVSMSIRSFYEGYKSGAISSNPNESIDVRWGIARETDICPKR